VATTGRTHDLLVRRGALRVGPPTLRVAADLSGGLDGFLSRRSAKFRAVARRARRRAAATGISYERQDHVDLDRLLAVEHRSWKWREETGLHAGPMLAFYQEMFPRVAVSGSLRVIFASRDGQDLAYCVGGLCGDTYRGLVSSFDDACADESPGVLVHLAMIERLCDEGIAFYDLGSDMEYKRRWGEPSLETCALLLPR
jgi:CelD/BcsL family acetyltransferase involved in cellulose biosynthesis